jgi:DNA polymerase-3 subunit delta'
VTTFDDIFGQQDAIDRITRAHESERLPHGLIFAGPIGVGKRTTATALAALFLCEKPKGTSPCGKCDSCRVLDAGTHPDFAIIYRQLVRLENKDSKAQELSIDVIRDFLVKPANLKPAMGRGRVFVVEEAERMSAAAQNALLKTLEEPVGRTLIILLTDQPNLLLPTVRSRCQTIRFAALEEKVIIRELTKRGIDKELAGDAARFADGSLGVAIQWIEDGVVELARELHARIDTLLAGQFVDDLQDWFKKASEAYAEKQLARDKLASKPQAAREGVNLYLRLAAQQLRQRLSELDDSEQLERTCGAIDTIARAETYLDANVNVPLVFQQLAVSLEEQLT